jgi:hypothetical protein
MVDAVINSTAKKVLIAVLLFFMAPTCIVNVINFYFAPMPQWLIDLTMWWFMIPIVIVPPIGFIVALLLAQLAFHFGKPVGPTLPKPDERSRDGS